MSHANVASWTLADYDRAAQEYCASLPLEHFMEGTGQSTQRKISWFSLLFVAHRLLRMQVFNELLVQYPRNGGLAQVVPDNMVIRSKRKLRTASSFNIVFETVYPFWMLEYVSKHDKRKDYEDNLVKYEQDLRVPYYLIFDPETRDLILYSHNGTRFERVEPNQHGRLAVPELQVEVALLDGWARFWFRGELVPLPEDLQDEVDKLIDQLDEARTEVVQARRLADRRKRRAEQERQQKEEARHQAEQEKQRAEQEKQRAEQEKQRADSAEEELRRLRELLEKSQGGRPTPQLASVSEPRTVVPRRAGSPPPKGVSRPRRTRG